jgi:SAM-dependent methyltransferase
MMNAEGTNSEFGKAFFDKAYRSYFAHWVWGDTRIPDELKELVAINHPKTSLELGCGLGRYSAYLAEQGIQATGIDFSEVVIEKDNRQFAGKARKPTFLVGDATNLAMLQEPFDVAFDIGCFHCLNQDGQESYAAEIYRLLKPGSTLLIWAIDHAPSGIALGPECMASIFLPGFQLANAKASQRRLTDSHWYWLVRKDKHSSPFISRPGNR